MIEIKVYVDIPEGAQDFYPREYMPGDMICFNYDSEWLSLDDFFRLVYKDVKSFMSEMELKNERKKKGKSKKR